MTNINQAVIDSSGNVTNVIVTDTTYVSPTGETLIPVGTSGAGIGWTYAAGVFTPPPIPLAQAQLTKTAQMKSAYMAAITAPVSFTTAAGVTAAFQADPQSVANLQSVLAAWTPKGTVPAGFYWVATDNSQPAFTFADLQGLAKAMAAQGWAAFQRLQTRKAAIAAATTTAEAQSVVW